MTRLAYLLLALPLVCSAARADDPEAGADAEGCMDHPLYTRMPSHHIASCDRADFELRVFPVGPPAGEGEMLKGVEVEGPTWRFHFAPDEGVKPASGLAVMRNFQNAGKKAGATVEGEYPDWCKSMYDAERLPDIGNGCTHYGTTLKLVRDGREIWTYVQAGDPGYVMVISERQAMKQDIAVNELVDKLNKDGFIALYVNFDTGKSTIKPDSGKTLDDAAAALKAAPDLKIEVGGHTDNVGGAEANQKLSEERAQAVMAALVSRGIPAARLTAKGYGQSAPVADNRSEDGRAKNRRVELTKK